MKREDVAVVAQILGAIKDCSEKLDEALERDDSEKIKMLKFEIIKFQRKVDELL